MTTATGADMHQWITDLFPICRSISGAGTRQSLEYFAKLLPDLEIYSIPSGTEVFDWTIPDEWNIRDAYIRNAQGAKIVDFQQSNLHVVGYSTPKKDSMTFQELAPHLFSLPERPSAIPYVTSYYRKSWGFCLPHRQLEELSRDPEAIYEVCIDSSLEPGELNYGDLVIPGKSREEVLFSSYLCHPSMANNELSGPAVMTALARWISQLSERKYTYRFVYSVETIGTIAYLSKHLEHLKNHLIAGFVLSCVGDQRTASYVSSRNSDCLSDRIAKHVLKHRHPDFMSYSFLDRGSDERQYCSPGVDLPVCTICRSKYGEFAEYHTSDDNLELVTARGLAESLEIVKDCVYILENNSIPVCRVLCEPQLGRRGMYPTTSTRESGLKVKCLTDLIAYSDGERDLVAIADHIGQPATSLVPMVDKLREENILSIKSG